MATPGNEALRLEGAQRRTSSPPRWPLSNLAFDRSARSGCIPAPQWPSDGQATALALRQGGKVYFAVYGTVPDMAWVRRSSAVGGAAYTTRGGIDDWQVTIHR